MRAAARALLLVFVAGSSLVLTASPASAQAHPQHVPSPEALEEARQQYARGVDLYARGKYDEARIAFEGAYARSQLPTLLPNIADCQERLGQDAAAAETLRQYLALPNVPDRESVQARLATIEERFKPAPPPAPPPESSTKVPRLRRAVIGSGIATGLLAATAAALTLAAASDYHSLAGDCRNGAVGCSSSSARSLERIDLAADVMWGLAGAAAITTVTLHLILRHEKKKLRASVGAAEITAAR
jgi:tetratricopeptide (TPR) repeat protein